MKKLKRQRSDGVHHLLLQLRFPHGSVGGAVPRPATGGRKPHCPAPFQAASANHHVAVSPSPISSQTTIPLHHFRTKPAPKPIQKPSPNPSASTPKAPGGFCQVTVKPRGAVPALVCEGSLERFVWIIPKSSKLLSEAAVENPVSDVCAHN